MTPFYERIDAYLERPAPPLDALLPETEGESANQDRTHAHFLVRASRFLSDLTQSERAVCAAPHQREKLDFFSGVATDMAADSARLLAWGARALELTSPNGSLGVFCCFLQHMSDFLAAPSAQTPARAPREKIITLYPARLDAFVQANLAAQSGMDAALARHVLSAPQKNVAVGTQQVEAMIRHLLKDNLDQTRTDLLTLAKPRSLNSAPPRPKARILAFSSNHRKKADLS